MKQGSMAAVWSEKLGWEQTRITSWQPPAKQSKVKPTARWIEAMGFNWHGASPTCKGLTKGPPVPIYTFSPDKFSQKQESK